jgi:glycosyltransferase involved in cell wall biosynthesis
MPRPRLLYASPFPPQQSGISEYSRVLVRGLRELFDVTLLTDDYAISDENLVRDFSVEVHRKDRWETLERFPYKIYNIGNNPWYHGYIYECCLHSPGVVILHDAIIYFLVVGLYQDRPDFMRTVYRLEGARGVSLIKEQLKSGESLLRYSQPRLMPFLRELLDSGNRILVHSEYALTLLRRKCSADTRLGRIDMAIQCDEQPDRQPASNMRERLGVPQDAVLLCSFGFVAPTKLNHLVCEAVRNVRRKTGVNFYYCMVGEGAYVDDQLCEHVRVTGYVSEDEYESYMRCANLVVNLRYPSMGETSIALLRAMSLGKPCIVTNHAWFSELPDSAVLKTGMPPRDDVVEQLTRAFSLFLERRSSFEKIGAAAAEYVRSRCAPLSVAERLMQYLS